MEQDSVKDIALYFMNVLIDKYIKIENYEFSQNKNLFTSIFKKVDYNQITIAYSQLLEVFTDTYEQLKNINSNNNDLKNILDDCFYYFGLLLMSCCTINNELHKKTLNQSTMSFDNYNLLCADRDVKRKLVEDNLDALNAYLQQTSKKEQEIK